MAFAFAGGENRGRVRRNRRHEKNRRWVEGREPARYRDPVTSGSLIAAVGYRDGILFLTLGAARQKIFELRPIAMGAIGQHGDIERLRMAAIEWLAPKDSPLSADVSRGVAHSR
jgi:hypothetical protein